MHRAAPAWALQESGADASTRVTVGKSGDAVWRLDSAGRPVGYLKRGRAGAIRAESARQRWLHAHSLAPAVIHERAVGRIGWLLSEAAPGAPMHEVDGPAAAAHAARALHALHALPVDRCPFDSRRPTRLREARQNVRLGRVDEDDFDEERLGLSASDVLALVERGAPPDRDLVVCHGDACLPNLVVEGDVARFVDCGRLGVGSRALDVALCARSLAGNFDDSAAEAFLAAYGADAATRAELAWERLIDELF